MEIKVVCGCGQKFKFDTEPVNGRMPVKVACPGCGADGTESANQFLAQQWPNQPPPIPVALLAQPAAPAAGAPAGVLRVSAPALAPVTAPPPPITPPAARAGASKPEKSGEYSLGLGVLGALLGAALGAGLMYGFFVWAHMRFPFMGTCIGALSGYGARLLARGTDMTLGVIAGGIALAATAGALYLMFGNAAAMLFVSILVSAFFAYRIAG